MTIVRDGERVILRGVCRVEDAEPLCMHLADGAVVADLSRCEGLHAAVAQALLEFSPRLEGEPSDPFVRDWVLPALRRHKGTHEL